MLDIDKVKVGDRVFVNHSSGFSKGSYGTVTALSKEKERVFARRDGEGGGPSAYFYPSELDLISKVTPEAYLWENPEGVLLSHEGGLDDLPEEAVRVWKIGEELQHRKVWK